MLLINNDLESCINQNMYFFMLGKHMPSLGITYHTLLNKSTLLESHLNKQMIMSAKTFFSTLQVAVYKDSLKLFWILSLITNQLDICLRFAESGWPSVNFFSSSTSITLFFGILIARNTPKPNNQVSFRNHDIMWFQTRWQDIIPSR